MGFISTLKVEKSIIKLSLAGNFHQWGPWASSLRTEHGTNHCAPYLQVPLTGAKINNEYHITNNYQWNFLEKVVILPLNLTKLQENPGNRSSACSTFSGNFSFNFSNAQGVRLTGRSLNIKLQFITTWNHDYSPAQSKHTSNPWKLQQHMTRKNYGSTRKPKRHGNTDHKKERFYALKPVKLIFFCFMHPSFTCRLAFVTCASHVQTLIVLVNL